MEQFKQDYRQLDLSQRVRAILDFSLKLTEAPASMEEADVQFLRTAGLEDAEILEVAEIASFFNYINRLADALGVNEVSPDWYGRGFPGEA